MPSRETDKQLIAQLIARDGAAWRQFVEQYQGLVFARIRTTAEECRRSLDVACIEDLCADVFSGLLANDAAALKNFRGESSLATWLSVIARRTCLKYLARKKNDPALPLDEQQDSYGATRFRTQDEAVDALIRAEELATLFASLTQLGDRDQSVLRLFYLQEMSYREIAETTGITVNSVGPALSRAVRRLRRACEVQSAKQQNPESPPTDGTKATPSRH